jgi:hypothetical protein
LAWKIPCVSPTAITDTFLALSVLTAYTPMSELPLCATSLKITEFGAEDSAGVRSMPPIKARPAFL